MAIYVTGDLLLETIGKKEQWALGKQGRNGPVVMEVTIAGMETCCDKELNVQ